MLIIFCSDPMNRNVVDMDYEEEYLAAKSIGISIGLIQLEDLLEGHINKALSKIGAADSQETALYRGWMIKPEIYENLYDGLLMKNIALINDPEEYRSCHYLPDSYEKIKAFTPYSNWIPVEHLQSDFEQIHKQLSEFGNKPIIVKDYVKSRKHEWNDAFYIPDASDHNQAIQVIRNFIERQGENINEGIVLREFVDLEPLSVHAKSQMPLSKEFRIFYFKNEFLFQFDYWEDSVYDNEKPDLTVFNQLAEEISSNFFTMDIGKTVSGDWIVIEVGDGQVSGLPLGTDTEGYYKAIKERVS